MKEIFDDIAEWVRNEYLKLKGALGSIDESKLCNRIRLFCFVSHNVVVSTQGSSSRSQSQSDSVSTKQKLPDYV